MSRYKIYHLTLLKNREDTRELAEEWVQKQISAGLGSRSDYKIIDSRDGYPIK